jgi:hypothetical protein
MPRRARIPVQDVNQLAHSIVQQATGQVPKVVLDGSVKNPAAVALGLLGGAKGGKARANGMTAKQRSIAARKAAKARWAK